MYFTILYHTIPYINLIFVAKLGGVSHLRSHAVVCFPAGARDADRVRWAVAETVALGKLIKMSEVHLQLTNTIAADFSAHCSRLRHPAPEQAAGRYSVGFLPADLEHFIGPFRLHTAYVTSDMYAELLVRCFRPSAIKMSNET
jgi:hypothetical protein